MRRGNQNSRRNDFDIMKIVRRGMVMIGVRNMPFCPTLILFTQLLLIVSMHIHFVSEHLLLFLYSFVRFNSFSILINNFHHGHHKRSRRPMQASIPSRKIVLETTLTGMVYLFYLRCASLMTVEILQQSQPQF